MESETKGLPHIEKKLHDIQDELQRLRKAGPLSGMISTGVAFVILGLALYPHAVDATRWQYGVWYPVMIGLGFGAMAYAYRWYRGPGELRIAISALRVIVLLAVFLLGLIVGLLICLF